MIHIPMEPWQAEFCADIETPELGLIGGLGSGKTFAFCIKAVMQAMVNVDGHQTVTRGGLVEPTNHLVKTHLIPNLFNICERMGVPYEWHASEQIIDLKFAGGNFPIMLTSGENYERLVGFNWAFFGAEELDTSPWHIAAMTWSKGGERVRWGKYRQKFTTTTIEGNKFVQHNFVNLASPKKRTIHANSEHSALLEKEYLDSLKDSMSPQEYSVRVQGNWGSISSNLVYPNLKPDYEGNWTKKTLKDFAGKPIIHVGMDFNVDYCASICHVFEGGKKYAIKEFTCKNNPETITKLKEFFKGHEIWCYPDTSGDNRNYVGYDTAVAQLRNAGLVTKINSRTGTTKSDDGKGSNPFVGDRIHSFNAQLLNTRGERNYLINPDQCPEFARNMTSQQWIQSSPSAPKRPDKSNNVDHKPDAAGYMVFYHHPPVKPNKTLTIR